MKGIDKITARIEDEARAEAARIGEEAAVRCEEIRAAGEKKAQEIYWQRVKESAQAAEERRQRLANTADMEARKSVLATKQSLVERAFCLAEEKLLAMPAGEYTAFLAALAVRASSWGDEEILLAGKDRALGEEIVRRANEQLAMAGRPAGLTLAAGAGDFSGGLILCRGNISVNCTVEALMTQAREEMTAETAAKLFS